MAKQKQIACGTDWEVRGGKSTSLHYMGTPCAPRGVLSISFNHGSTRKSISRQRLQFLCAWE